MTASYLRASARTLFGIAAIIAPCQTAAAQPQVAPFLNILPGTTTKAELDLTLGDPRRRLTGDDEIYEYAPPRTVEDTDRIIVSFWSDSRTVARIDVYFKVPLPADPLRDRIGGTRVVSREHAGIREELYYPRLDGLILAGSDAQAAAFSYLSQRYLASVYVERFDSLLSAKNLDAALVEAEKAAVVDPEGAQGYLAQGKYFESIGNFDEALAHYTTAVNAKTGQRERFRAALALAAMYETYRKAVDRADAEYKRALALAVRADGPEAHVVYGDFLTRQKKADEARAEYERAVELNPNHVKARAAMAATHWEKKAYGEALADYEVVIKAESKTGRPDPGRGLVMFRYAYCLAEAGRDDDALAAFDQAIAANGPEAESRFQRGLLERKNDHVRAIREFREGLNGASTDAALNRGLTNSLLLAGLTPDALKQAEASLKLAPQDPQRLLDVARSYGALKKKKESFDFARRAVASGLTDHKALTQDPTLALLQTDGDFKKLVGQLR